MRNVLRIGISAAIAAVALLAPSAAQAAPPSDPAFTGLVPIPAVHKANGPTDIYREASTVRGSALQDVLTPAVSSLPFNFVLDHVSYGINSRSFRPGENKICVDMRLWWDEGPSADYNF